jgi:hypothetical protein
MATMLGVTQANVQKIAGGGSGDVLTNMVATDMDGADMYSAIAALY